MYVGSGGVTGANKFPFCQLVSGFCTVCVECKFQCSWTTYINVISLISRKYVWSIVSARPADWMKWSRAPRVLQQVRHMYSCTINTLWIQLCVVISIHSSYVCAYMYMERRTVNVSRIEIETVIRYFRCNCEQRVLGLNIHSAVCVSAISTSEHCLMFCLCLPFDWSDT